MTIAQRVGSSSSCATSTRTTHARGDLPGCHREAGGGELRHSCARFAATFPASFARWSSATSTPRSLVSRPSDQMPGTGSSAIPRPAELHPFREFHAGNRHAPATPGDMLFHIRAQRMDICFELATQIMDRIGDAVSVADEVQGFRYFEDRDLIGFVDGTENPRGTLALESALVGEEDAPFAGGSYVLVQKYLHDMKAWNALSTEAQEGIIGRRKLSDIELEDGVKPTSAHSALTVIEENGKEVKILRDNMPFGQPGRGEFGTYFIGYCRTPRITEQMLENMVVGRPPGNYDRLLDFSRAVTGGLFFAPSANFLDDAGGCRAAPCGHGRAAGGARSTPRTRCAGRITWDRIAERRTK